MPVVQSESGKGKRLARIHLNATLTRIHLTDPLTRSPPLFGGRLRAITVDGWGNAGLYPYSYTYSYTYTSFPLNGCVGIDGTP